MTELTSLRAEHGQIERLAGALGRIVMRPLPPPPAEFSRIRHDFNHGLKRHLQHEDAILYPRLLQSGNDAVRGVAKRLLAESGALAERFDAYCARWSGSAIAADWSGFRFATMELLGLIDRRIIAEEFELYPLLAADQADRGGGARWCSLPTSGPPRLRLVARRPGGSSAAAAAGAFPPQPALYAAAMTSRTRNVIAGLIAGYLGAALLAVVALSWWWARDSLPAPDPARGIAARLPLWWDGYVPAARADLIRWLNSSILLASPLVWLIRPKAHRVTLGSRWGFSEVYEVDDPERLVQRAMLPGFLAGLVLIGAAVLIVGAA